jgi:hypothetical protein
MAMKPAGKKKMNPVKIRVASPEGAPLFITPSEFSKGTIIIIIGAI